MKVKRSLFFILISIIFVPQISWGWTLVDQGIFHQKFRFTPTKSKKDIDVSFEVIKIDPTQVKIKTLLPKNSKIKTIKDLTIENKAILGINSNFFDKKNNPLGLIINENKLIHKLKDVSWWGVFYIKENKPYIVHTQDFKSDPKISFALQAGPRLIVDKKAQILKPNRSAKTAIAINDQNEIFLIITRQYIEMITLTEFLSTPIKSGGLKVSWALNLDGGSSSQLYLKTDHLEIDIPGIKSIPVGLGIE